MNIALITGIFFPHPGGAQVQTHNLANKLNEKKINIDCYIFDKSNLYNNSYNIILLNKFILSLVFFCKYYLNLNIYFLLKIYLNKIIKKKNYDIWHFNFINYKSLILIDCLKDLEQKVLVTFQGIDIQLNKEIGYGYRLDDKYAKYLKIIIEKVDHFSSLSDTIKKDLLNLKIPLEKIDIIPNAVDTGKFTELKKNKLFSKKINLITVARFSEKKKGFDLLPLVASKLIDLNIDFKWTIVGKNTKKLLKDTVIKNNLENFVIIEDIINFDEKYLPNSSLIKRYINSDVYLNLSRIESFGITFVEALASGIPVVSFDTKGVNEIIKNNYNGYIIKDNSIELLANKISDIANNQSLIESLKEGILISSKQYDLNLITNKFLKIYQSLQK